MMRALTLRAHYTPLPHDAHQRKLFVDGLAPRLLLCSLGRGRNAIPTACVLVSSRCSTLRDEGQGVERRRQILLGPRPLT